MVNEHLQIPTSLPRNETEYPALDNLGRGFTQERERRKRSEDPVLAWAGQLTLPNSLHVFISTSAQRSEACTWTKPITADRVLGFRV